MNLAQSLLDACERHPELEAFPGIRYGELLPRVARDRRRPRASSRARAVAVVLDNRLETALLYWACQWAGAVVRAALLAALGRGARLLRRRLPARAS